MHLPYCVSVSQGFSGYIGQLYQGSYGDWKTLKFWKKKLVMVLGKLEGGGRGSQNNFTNFAPEFYQICAFFASIAKFRISLKSPLFSTFSTKCNN